jgi:hypothetical protein
MSVPLRIQLLAGTGRWSNTTYDADVTATLAAGFTCKSGRKYCAYGVAPQGAEGIGWEELKQAYDIELEISGTSVDVRLYDNSTVTLTLAELRIDLTEVIQNFYNIWSHSYV